jgi:hypothetical protein
MTPLSSDDQARAIQLANLVPGGAPAPLGNQRSRKHGAFALISRDQLDDEMRELYDCLSGVAPLRDADGELPAADEAAVEVAARALRRWREVAHWCDTHSRITPKGDLVPAAAFELACERALHRALDVLGLTPRSRAKLGLKVAQAAAVAPDLARQIARHSEGNPDA